MGKSTINWGSDEEFINNYLNLKSSRKMGELYHCDKSSVLNHAKKIGFNPNEINREYKLSEQDKKEILEAYNKETSTALAEKYKVSRGMITKLWYDADLKGKKITRTPKYDLTGQKIGKLTVLYPTEEREANGNILWKCICDCGKETLVSGYRLQSGEAKSCGCLSKESLKLGRQVTDITGKVFGKLTVLRQAEYRTTSSGRSQVQWECQCTCGRKTLVDTHNLTTGNTQSCGFCGEKSHGNLKIEQLLTEAKIPFVREQKFSSCKDKAMLPFDFYVNNTYLIEYDGKQHFKDEGFFDFEGTHKRDQIKNKWCKENNIPLIRIPYTHYDELNLNDLLLETSQFIQK